MATTAMRLIAVGIATGAAGFTVTRMIRRPTLSHGEGHATVVAVSDPATRSAVPTDQAQSSSLADPGTRPPRLSPAEPSPIVIDELDTRLLEGELDGRQLMGAVGLKAALEREVVKWALAARGRCPGLANGDPTAIRISCQIAIADRAATFQTVDSVIIARGAPVAPSDLECLVAQIRRTLPGMTVPAPPELSYSGSKEFLVTLREPPSH